MVIISVALTYMGLNNEFWSIFSCIAQKRVKQTDS